MTNHVAPEADDYLLDRSYAASARLNLQHCFWKDDVGQELLHQTIPVTDGQLSVADVGTGTGIWLLDFARQHPQSARLDGLDISLDQVPPAAWLPSNVSFYRYDIFEEPPKHLAEKYDIVHVRHLTLVVKQNDPTSVLNNLLKLLSTLRFPTGRMSRPEMKPGGYLQWGEFDLRNRIAVTVQPECSTIEMKGLQHRMRDFLHTPVASWPEKLGIIFEKAGLQDISFEGKMTEHGHLSFHMDVSLLVYEELIDMIASQQRGTPEEIRELRTRLAKAAAESRRGAAWNIKKLVAVGRKAT